MSAGEWRVEANHVYQGYRLVATFSDPTDARACVETVNARGWRTIDDPAPYSDHMHTLLVFWKRCGWRESYWDVDDQFDERPSGWKSPEEGWRAVGDQCIPINQEDATHWMLLPAPPQVRP